jgi:hypothetical protein
MKTKKYKEIQNPFVQAMVRSFSMSEKEAIAFMKRITTDEELEELNK